MQFRRCLTSAVREIRSPDNPEVIAAVPRPPETQSGVVVRHAADHVFGRVDPVREGPQAEEAPGD